MDYKVHFVDGDNLYILGAMKISESDEKCVFLDEKQREYVVSMRNVCYIERTPK